MSCTEWENGTLGRDATHTAIASGSKQETDAALGLQQLSIRLPESLLEDLKRIAEHQGIGYQPMIRDLLSRFAECGMASIT